MHSIGYQRAKTILPIVVSIVICGTIRAHAIEGCKPKSAGGPSRCFALLVGVDQYAKARPGEEAVEPLKGPANDVALMKGLLVSQFDFEDDAAHILTLVGPQATHRAIIEALSRQLIDNAKKIPGSKVLFYFSGHGRQITDSEDRTGSGYHQSLLAYDSQAEGGTDILDDEINLKLDVLRRYTDQITILLDSCHSGGVWKDVGTITSKAAPPKIHGVSNERPSKWAPRDLVSTIRPIGGEFSAIVAATADQDAVEDEVQTKEGLKYHGLMTFYLDKIVRSSPALTYDELAQRVAAAISDRAPSQQPQAEGDINRYFLSGFGDRKRPFIHVLSVSADRKIEIGGGAADGLHNGAILAVYSQDSNSLSGDVNKLANAAITQVSSFTSIAQLADAPRAPITKNSKVQIVTPFSPTEGTAVFLPAIVGELPPELKAGAFLGRLSQLVKQNRLLSIVKDPHDAKIVVRLECKDKARLSDFDTRLIQPSDLRCSSGYLFYLSAPDQPQILFNLTVDADGDPSLLAEAAAARAQQDNLRSLENRTSDIKAEASNLPPIMIEMQTLDVDIDIHGWPVIRSVAPLADDGVLKIGDHFQLKITNNSSRTLYAVVIWLGSGGGVQLFTQAHNGDQILPGNTLVTWPPLTAGGPEGLETYKVIVTTQSNVDFRMLDQQGITREAIHSPLEWLLNQTGNSVNRDRGVASDLDLGDWITAQRNVVIVR